MNTGPSPMGGKPPFIPLPLGDCAPPPTLYGPEQPLPARLERIEQGQLGMVPLGPLFEVLAEPEAPPSSEPKS